MGPLSSVRIYCGSALVPACAWDKIIGINYNIVSLLLLCVITMGIMTTREEDIGGWCIWHNKRWLCYW